MSDAASPAASPPLASSSPSPPLVTSPVASPATNATSPPQAATNITSPPPQATNVNAPPPLPTTNVTAPPQSTTTNATSAPPPPSTNSTSPLSSSPPPPPNSDASTPPNSPPPPGSPSVPQSPPPSSTSLSPPAPGTSIGSANQPSPSPSSSSVSAGVVIGIAVGAVSVVLIFSILFLCCCRRKRKRHPESSNYGYPLPPPAKYGASGAQQQNWQHNQPPPMDNVVKIPPPQPAPPTYISHPPYSPIESSSSLQTPLPPPPPPPFSSSGGSESNFSGGKNPLPPPSPGIALGFSKNTFTISELSMASDGFSDANLLGQGGFGYVHRGILSNGKEVAIKQLKSGSGQGEREFQAEVEIISRVHHRHLVSLVGYCIAGEKRLLVYEFVPNNTLEFHLHENGRPLVEWSTRLKIALGSAKGLSYLHEDCHPKIIHRDIKSSNILLDFKFEAKVADFGLAKFASDANTHVSTRVMGTFGYLAPEYASTGKLTDKSDVFSFGVVLLELITGRRPVDKSYYLEDSLVDWARPLMTRALEEEIFDALVDPKLRNDYNREEMARMVACAAACVRHSARRRPRMSQVVRALEGGVSLDDLNEGVTPGHSGLYGSSDYDSNTSRQYDTRQYNEDMKRMRKLALESQEHASSEYSNPTSEYSIYPSGSSGEGKRY